MASWKVKRIKSSAAMLGAVCSNKMLKKKTGIYYGWIGFSNFGDEVLYSAFRELLGNRISSITQSDYDRALGVVKNGFKPDYFILGGGTLINRTDAILNDLTQYAEMAADRIVFGSGVANIDFWDTLEKRVVRLEDWADFFSKCKFVGVRGPNSKQALEGIGVSSIITGDPALVYAHDEIPDKSNSSAVGINFGFTKDKLWGGSDESFSAEMVSLIKILLDRNENVKICSVCDVDHKYVTSVLNENGLLSKVDMFDASNASPEEMLDYFKDVKLFLGEKLHASIFAACAHTPFIMAEYRPKCEDFMKSIGMDRYNIRTSDFKAEGVIDLIDDMFGNYTELQHTLYSNTMYLKNTLVSSFQRLVV